MKPALVRFVLPLPTLSVLAAAEVAKKLLEKGEIKKSVRGECCQVKEDFSDNVPHMLAKKKWSSFQEKTNLNPELFDFAARTFILRGNPG